MRLKYSLVLEEVSKTLDNSNFDELDKFVSSILQARKIVVYGAGRVGLAMRSFAMRLTHLGLDSYFLGDINVPNTNSSDLLIIGSGSGNTPSVAVIAELANRAGTPIITITTNLESRVGKIADCALEIASPTKESSSTSRVSAQPMTTLFEQTLLLVLDSLVLVLMEEMGETHESMLGRHNTLE